MKISAVVLCLLMGLVLSDSTIAINFDPVESLTQANLPLLERVEQRAVVDYAFILNGNNLGNRFPELDITFTLDFDQYVKIKYHTAYCCSASCYLYTILHADGVENIYFRDHEYSIFPTTSSYGEVFMKAGTHRLTLYYLTNNAALNQVGPQVLQ